MDLDGGDRTPASGERAAVRGYSQQYDQLAAEIYYSLAADSFEWAELVSDDAGQIDDLVIARAGRVEGYQYKHGAHPESLTLGDLTADRRSRSGKKRPSLISALADGWRLLTRQYGDCLVHLATNHYASTNDKAVAGPPARHFADLVSEVLSPIAKGEMSLADVPTEWSEGLGKIETASGLSKDEFPEFLRCLRLDLGINPPTETPDERAASDIVALSHVLFRHVAERDGPVRLDGMGGQGQAQSEPSVPGRSRHIHAAGAGRRWPLGDSRSG